MRPVDSVEDVQGADLFSFMYVCVYIVPYVCIVSRPAVLYDSDKHLYDRH